MPKYSENSTTVVMEIASCHLQFPYQNCFIENTYIFMLDKILCAFLLYTCIQ